MVCSLRRDIPPIASSTLSAVYPPDSCYTPIPMHTLPCPARFYPPYRSVTAGIDALGEVTVRVQDELSKREYIGKAADTDVIHASAEAYLHAVNRLLSNRGQPDKAHPQKDVM